MLALIRSGFIAVGLVLFCAGVIRAATIDVPLNPNDFASVGSLSGATTYAFDTGFGLGPPTLTEPGGVVFNGVYSNGVAVFDFSDINLAAGSSLTAVGSFPLAILSRGSAILNGSVN